MKPQSLLLGLGFWAMVAVSTRCEKPDPNNNVTPTAVGCDTCTTPALCAPFSCTTKPPLCPTCVVTNPVTACSGTPVFSGKINRGSGIVNFSAPVIKAYIYTATQGTALGKRMLVISAQNKDVSNKIDETFSLSLELTASGAGNYTVQKLGNNTFSYATKNQTDRIYYGIGSVTIGSINADSTITGAITSVTCSKSSSTATIALSNITFDKICYKNFLPTTATTFEMPTLASVAANWKATKVKAHIGEGPDIGRIVVEAEDNGTPKPKKMIVKIPLNTATSTSTSAFSFPDNNGTTGLVVEDVFVTYNDGSTTASYESTYNGSAGAPLKSCKIGQITHNRENRTIQIDNINLMLSRGGTIKNFIGKLNAKY